MDPELKKALEALGMTQQQAVEAQEKAHAEFKAAVDADSKKRDALYEDKIAKLSAELDKFEPLSAALAKAEENAKAATEQAKKQQEQLDRIEAALQRPPQTAADEKQAKAQLYKDAFAEYLRKGRERSSQERMNVLKIGDDTTGGYLATPEYVMQIIKDVVEFSPMRGLVTVRNTSRSNVQFPKRTGTFAATWVGEDETRSETTGLTWGLEDIFIHEMTAESYVTMANLEDSNFDLESILREEFAEQFGVAEGTALVSGNGIKKPQGFLNATGTNSVNSGNATLITADGILALKYAIKSVYARAASFLLARGTLEAIRKLKDGNGQYLWVPGLAVGRPNTIDGDPYTEVVDMPAISAGTKPMAFGDWKRAMTLVDRIDMAILVDPYTRAGSGQMKYVARRRLGGQVVLAAAIAIMTVSA